MLENEARRLENEALSAPKPPQEAFETTEGALGALWGWFWEPPGTSLGAPWASWRAPGLLWGALGRALGVILGAFCSLFEEKSNPLNQNSEKLDFDDPLNENAMFLRSQGLQNETKMVPEEQKREGGLPDEGPGGPGGDIQGGNQIREYLTAWSPPQGGLAVI